jgi:hypothetical protein
LELNVTGNAGREYLYKAKVKAIKDALFVIVFSFVLSKF